MVARHALGKGNPVSPPPPSAMMVLHDASLDMVNQSMSAMKARFMSRRTLHVEWLTYWAIATHTYPIGPDETLSWWRVKRHHPHVSRIKYDIRVGLSVRNNTITMAQKHTAVACKCIHGDYLHGGQTMAAVAKVTIEAVCAPGHGMMPLLTGK